MAICKDCMCFEVCDKKFQYMFIGSPFCMSNYMYGVEERCKDFKDKSQFIQVVRCKDCRYFISKANLTDEYDNPLGYDGLCDNNDKYTDANDFCSCGKRKTE